MSPEFENLPYPQYFERYSITQLRWGIVLLPTIAAKGSCNETPNEIYRESFRYYIRSS